MRAADADWQPMIKARRGAIAAALLAAMVAAGVAAGPSAAVAPTYHTVYRAGKIVPLGDSVPHAEGVMVDRRIVDDLQYLADRYPIYVVEGYAGPLAGFGRVGCPLCHVKHSDHKNGLAADIVPIAWDGRGCDRSWRRLTRLAHWAEPRQNRPRLPFRWVGYNGDYNHGCGNHLHLSWDHAPAKPFRIADWVVILDASPIAPAPPHMETPTPPQPTPVPPEGTP
jgi:hypothetical protein